MLITCPHCFAKFNLPDTKVTPDAKLRCSFCNTVFSLQEGTQQQESSSSENNESQSFIAEEEVLPTVPKKKKTKLIIGSSIFFLLFFSAAVWVYLTQYKQERTREQQSEQAQNLLQEQIKELSIKDYRQYFITNNPNVQKPFFVVEGKIKNNSKDAKAFIVVKASLFNEQGDLVVEQEMLAGVALSLFQLQTMKEDAMEEFLKDPLEIAVTNSNVLPQNEVPFMLLFFDPPREITEFSIQIVSATKAESFESS